MNHVFMQSFVKNYLKLSKNMVMSVALRLFGVLILILKMKI